MATKDRPDSQPPANLGGRPSALNSEHIAALHEIVSEHAQASLAEIASDLERRCGVHVCEATIRRALHAEGIVRLKTKRRLSPTADKGPKRYGYTAAHRRKDVPFYSTNLTDAEWDLVADLFERAPGQRGTPAHYSRRELVNACSYILRTGCAWRLLPTTFPPWQAVYKTFVRWVVAGVFEQMQDRLRQQRRTRMGHASEPTAAVIDAQSNRSSPRGGESGFDAGKKVKGRKRNLVVDTMGLVIALTVTVASVQDGTPPQRLSSKRVRRRPSSKSSTPTVPTLANALAPSSSNTIFVSKSSGVLETAQPAPCKTLHKEP